MRWDSRDGCVLKGTRIQVKVLNIARLLRYLTAKSNGRQVVSEITDQNYRMVARSFRTEIESGASASAQFSVIAPAAWLEAFWHGKIAQWAVRPVIQRGIGFAAP